MKQISLKMWFTQRVLSTSLIAGVLMTSVNANAATDYADNPKYKEAAERCAAMYNVDIQRAGPNPGNIVTSKLMIDVEAVGRESVLFMKRGHSQGNPTPKSKTYPNHCLVEGYVAPHVQFAIRLPLKEDWNGRFMLAACDAWCGKVHPEITVPGLADGYATLTNNGGHYSRIPFDGVWAYNDYEAREYFAHKANHVTASVGKFLTEAFYGKAPKYSYITGFSKGGNAGLFAAQKYPEDFDGIFVKAPVVKYNEKNAAHFTWTARAIYPDGVNPVIEADKELLIRKSVHEACDAIDGLEDGIIDDPRDCDYDPIGMLCKDGQSEANNECLNMAQVEAVRKVWSKPTKDGKVYHEYVIDRGSSAEWLNAVLPNAVTKQKTIPLAGTETGLPYMALWPNPGPGWDWKTFDFTQESERLQPMNDLLNPDSPDLTAFRDTGGKMIVVHGWADPLISARMTIDYWHEMTEFMGGEKAVGKFAQFYLVPGMVHGSGGMGPYVYDGQAALVDWVEKGIKPKKLIMEDVEGHVPFRTRPMFPYPAISKYKGKGDPNKASSYKSALKK